MAEQRKDARRRIATTFSQTYANVLLCPGLHDFQGHHSGDTSSASLMTPGGMLLVPACQNRDYTTGFMPHRRANGLPAGLIYVKYKITLLIFMYI